MYTEAMIYWLFSGAKNVVLCNECELGWTSKLNLFASYKKMLFENVIIALDFDYDCIHRPSLIWAFENFAGELNFRNVTGKKTFEMLFLLNVDAFWCIHRIPIQIANYGGILETDENIEKLVVCLLC